jgi:hypothetical protein
MKSTTATFASLMFAVAVVGFTATVESQDKAPAPVVEGQDQKPPTPHDAAALPESQEKVPTPVAEDQGKAQENTAALPESKDKAPAPVAEDQGKTEGNTAALPESQEKAPAPVAEDQKSAALPESQEKASAPKPEVPDKTPPPASSQDQKAAVASEIVVYASDLSERALFEFEFWPSRQSPGGKMVGTIQTGDKLNPPPEEDPHVNIKVKVQGGVAYRCWVRMLVGEPMGISEANRLYVQFSYAVDKAGKDVFRPNTASYLTVQGPTRRGWKWVPCDADFKPADSLIYFSESREVTVKVQAGMEGVGFDQFVLSPAQFLEKPPAEAVVKK